VTAPFSIAAAVADADADADADAAVLGIIPRRWLSLTFPSLPYVATPYSL